MSRTGTEKSPCSVNAREVSISLKPLSLKSQSLLFCPPTPGQQLIQVTGDRKIRPRSMLLLFVLCSPNTTARHELRTQSSGVSQRKLRSDSLPFCFYEKMYWLSLCRLNLFMYFLASIDKDIQAIFPNVQFPAQKHTYVHPHITAQVLSTFPVLIC